MKMLNERMSRINEELYNAAAEGNVQELNVQVSGIRYRLANLYAMDDPQELPKELAKYQKWVDGAACVFETDEEKTAYQIGLLGGTVAAVVQLREQQEQIKNYELSHLDLDTKYQDQIIEQLMEKEYVQHNELAQRLGISSSQLTVIMNKVEGKQQNIVSVSREGKFKYYCLTDMGRRYYNNQHKGNFREEIAELLQCVLERGKYKKKNSIKNFVDRYYANDVEMKQKAMEVEICFDGLEDGNGRWNVGKIQVEEEMRRARTADSYDNRFVKPAVEKPLEILNIKTNIKRVKAEAGPKKGKTKGLNLERDAIYA